MLDCPQNDDNSAENEADRQTNSFIENSIEAGILLGGNGAFTP
jgi:hypothetical protein